MDFSQIFFPFWKLNETDAEYEKIKDKSKKPKKCFRSEMAKSENIANESVDGKNDEIDGSIAVGQNESHCDETIDPYDLAEAFDLASKIDDSLYHKIVILLHFFSC